MCSFRPFFLLWIYLQKRQCFPSLSVLWKKKKKVLNYGSILPYFFPVVYLGDMLMPKHTGQSPSAYCLVFIVSECLFQQLRCWWEFVCFTPPLFFVITDNGVISILRPTVMHIYDCFSRGDNWEVELLGHGIYIWIWIDILWLRRYPEGLTSFLYIWDEVIQKGWKLKAGTEVYIVRYKQKVIRDHDLSIRNYEQKRLSEIDNGTLWCHVV